MQDDSSRNKNDFFLYIVRQNMYMRKRTAVIATVYRVDGNIWWFSSLSHVLLVNGPTFVTYT